MGFREIKGGRITRLVSLETRSLALGMVPRWQERKTGGDLPCLY